ncbi:MAG: inner membrane-spanning protein YciB [Halocynthiibacter sp.]
MAEKETKAAINPILKMALELGPVVIFFVLYGRIKDQVFTILGTEYAGFIVATAAFIPLMLVSIVVLWIMTGHLSKMQVMTAVLVIVFGGMSVYFNDERFFKMKPTILYVFFAGVLGFGLMRGKSYLQSVMEGALPMTGEGFMILTKRLTFFFLGLAIANEAVWRLMSTEAWVNFKTFGLTIALFVFLMSQGKLMAEHSTEETDDA